MKKKHTKKTLEQQVVDTYETMNAQYDKLIHLMNDVALKKDIKKMSDEKIPKHQHSA